METCKDCKWYCSGKGYCVLCGNKSNFTPKKPKEPEKECETCGESEPTRNKAWPNSIYCKKNKVHYPKNTAAICWQPIEKPKEEKKERDHQAHIGLLNSRLQKQKAQYQERLAEMQKLFQPPKSKENKMNRIKKWIRRFVMGCTVYCTAKICIALNPWVCKLWQIATRHDKNFWDECPSVPALSWFFTICSIAAIIGIVIAFEKITSFVFGKLEK